MKAQMETAWTSTNYKK